MLENPYNPLQPVTDPTLFCGREDALAFLQLHLSGRVTNHALVILGQQGIGKTSLLTHVPLVVDERYPSIYIDLNTLELDNPVALVAAIVDKTRAMMSAIRASTYRLPPFPDPTDPDVDLLAWLADEYLGVVFSAIRRERHLILMLDDIHLLFEAVEAGHFPPDFMDYWRRLLDRYEQLDLLAALDIVYEQQALQTPPFDDETLYFRLTNLSPEEAQQLITEPVAESYSFVPDALEAVFRLAGGHPYHLHAMGRLIYRRWEEARHIKLITLEDVEAVYPAALEMPNQPIGLLWEHLRLNERLAVAAMLDLRQQSPEQAIVPAEIEKWLSRTDYPLNELQLAASFRGLEYWGLVRSDEDGHYHFSAELQADWLEGNRALAFDELDVSPEESRLSVMALLAVAVVVVVIAVGGIAMGVFSGDDEEREAAQGGPATATLDVDLIATREAGYMTQTAEAIPTDTPTATATASATATRTPTATATQTSTPSVTPTPTPLPPFQFGG